MNQQIWDLERQIQRTEETTASSAVIKEKQEQISNIQDQISALSSKEEQLAALEERIRQIQADIGAAQNEAEAQQLALEKLDVEYKAQSRRRSKTSRSKTAWTRWMPRGWSTPSKTPRRKWIGSVPAWPRPRSF